MNVMIIWFLKMFPEYCSISFQIFLHFVLLLSAKLQKWPHINTTTLYQRRIFRSFVF